MYADLFKNNGIKELRIAENSRITIGRGNQEDGCHHTIDDEYMSRQHAAFIFNKELCIQDLCSRNGSYINGRRMNPNEIIPLSEGDYLKLGNTEFRIHFESSENAIEMSDNFRYRMRNSVGGRKLQIETSERGCLEYQIRMIEENSSLCIAEVIHVSNIDRDCFLCDLGSFISLRDIMETGNQKINGPELLESIVKLVKLGEEHMLDRMRYIIAPDTVFMDNSGNLRLIYSPCIEKKQDNFAGELEKLCDFMAENCDEEYKEMILSLKEGFKNEGNNTSELLKEIYRNKNYDIDEKPSKKKKRAKKKRTMKAEYVVTMVSFVVIMTVYWMEILNSTDITALALIIAGINLVIYGLSGENSKKIKGIFGKKEPSETS